MYNFLHPNQNQKVPLCFFLHEQITWRYILHGEASMGISQHWGQVDQNDGMHRDLVTIMNNLHYSVDLVN